MTRKPPLQHIGITFVDNYNTREMLSTAGLSNWNVTKEDLEELTGLHNPNKKYATIRNSDQGQIILGTVGQQYSVVQNEDAFDWADGVLDGGGRWTNAGAFQQGAKVFGQMLINESLINVDRGGINDSVRMYLLISNSHDGSLPLQVSLTPIRVICQNTLNMALKNVNASEVPQTFKVRHSGSAELKSIVARDALRLTYKYAEDFNVFANKLHQRPMNKVQWDRIVDTFVGQEFVDDSPKTVTMRNKKRDVIHELLYKSTNYAIKDTAWGGVNTLIEYQDWYRSENFTETKALAAGGFSATANAKKIDITELVLHHTS